MKSEVITSGPWQQPVKVTNCLCEDGRYRTAFITGEPDTYFSIPARITGKGKTISGFVSCNSDGVYKFIAYKYRKNGNLLKEEV